MAKIDKKVKSDFPPPISKIKLNFTDEICEFAESIINTMREPLLILDKDLRVLKASRSFYNFFKVISGETIGKLIYDLGNKQWNIPKLRELLETILPEKTTFDNYEVEHDFSSIGKRIMLLNARQIVTAPGKEKIILLAIEDITERKHEEEVLSEKSRMTNEFLDILLNHAHIPIIVWNSSLVITRFNHEFENLSGYFWEEVRDKKIDILFPEDKIDSTIELIRNNISNERSEVIEIDILTKDKKIKTVLWNSSNIFDKEENNIVATVAQDITKRKQTEEALSNLETRYRRLFETAKDGILILDAETGKIIDVNPFLIELLGYSKEIFIEKSIWEIGFFKDIAANEDKFLELQRKEYVRYDNLPLETADGRKINVEFVSNVYLVNSRKVIQCNIRDITKRKHTEEALLESELKYRTLVTQSPDGIFIVNLSGTFLSVNQTMCDLLHYTEEEFLSMRIWDIILKKYMLLHKDRLSNIMKGERINAPAEYEVIGKDGIVHSIEVLSAPYYKNKEIIGFQGIARDITERKRIENELRKLSRAVEQSPASIIITDTIGNIDYINPKLTEITGYQFAEVRGKNPRIFSSKEKLKSDYKVIWDTIISGKEWNGELHNKKKNGELYWVSASISSIINEKGETTNYLAVEEDITERKLATEQISMLAYSLKSINECVSVTDMENNIIFVNESFLKTYGYDEDELIGKSIYIVRSKNNAQELVEDILPATIRGEWSGELMNKRKDGSEFPVYLSTTIINDKDGRPLGLIGVATDITERKQILEELITAKERAEQSDKLKSEFLAQMSHEIRTPLNTIVGNADYLSELFNEQLDSDTNNCFDSIDRASKRIIRTVELILNAAELQISGYNPHFVKFDLNSEILDILFQSYQLSAKQKGLEFIYTCNEKDSKVIADEYSITQIFNNLIDNAFKYTKKGKVEILLVKNKNGDFVAEVKDTGIGISKEFLPKIFEQFSQEEQGYSRSFDGNGLGLTLVKRYCELNDLILEVESEKNVGSTFRIIFNNKFAEE